MTATHEGERRVHQHYGLDMEDMQRDMNRNYFNAQHARFFGELPFLIAAARDTSGNVWCTIVARGDGPVCLVRDDRNAQFNVPLGVDDPLAKSFSDSKSNKVGKKKTKKKIKRKKQFPDF
jgi:predicted pyridoxine 5'-phosphate oxidase superfamily flavin-nucleotide-binding protein